MNWGQSGNLRFSYKKITKPLLTAALSLMLVLSLMPLGGNGLAIGQGSSFDFGDAPDGGPTGYPAPYAQIGSFPSLLASGGARTQSTSDATLGPTATLEANALVTNADSDDGVSGLVILPVSIPAPAELSVIVNPQPGGSGGTFFLNVLLDLNLDGEWGGSTVNGQPEWAVQNFPVNVPSDNSDPITVSPPAFAFSNGNALPNGAWMRLALTSEAIQGSWDGTGAFASGEIEDHVITMPLINGKTPAIPTLLGCAPNPVIFAAGSQIAFFSCTVGSPTPGRATLTFNCAGGINIMDFGNIGPPYPVGPGGPVALNFIATKAPNPPPKVQCTVVASSVDPPSVVTETGVTLGYSDSVTTVEFDAFNEEAALLTYAPVSETTFSVGGEAILWDTFPSGHQVAIQNSIINTQDIALDMIYIVQVLDEDGAAVHISWQETLLTPRDPVQISTSWNPEQAGNYTVRTFAWESLENPIPLSHSGSAEISITEPAATRPAGYWASHPGEATALWEEVVDKRLHLECSDFSVDSGSRMMGGLWANAEENAGGEERAEINQARIELASQILAARLNQEAFGSVPDGFGLIMMEAEALFCSTMDNEETLSAMLAAASSLEAFNARGAGIDSPGYESTPEDSGLAQEIADTGYWDEGILQEEEEEPSQDPLETGEMSFAHRVGDTECPQFIGTVLLDSDGDGQWVAEHPEWLTIEIDGGRADFYFNCNIEDTSSHTIDAEVQLVFISEEEDAEETDPVEILVAGEIIGEGE